MEEGEGDHLSPWTCGNLMSVHLAFRVAIESNILNIIDSAGAAAQLSAIEMAFQIPIHNPCSISILDRLLCYLSVKLLLTSSSRPDGPNTTCRVRTFGLSNGTQYMVTNKNGNSNENSIAPLMIFGAESVIFERINMLKDAILYPENSPFFTSKRADLFDISSRNPSLNKSFNGVMVFWSRIVIRKVLALHKGFQEMNEFDGCGRWNGYCAAAHCIGLSTYSRNQLRPASCYRRGSKL